MKGFKPSFHYLHWLKWKNQVNLSQKSDLIVYTNMKIQDYFSQVKSYTLSDSQKADIFSTITQKRFQQSVAKWHFFSFKKLAYAVITGAMILWVGWFFVEQNIWIDNLFIQKWGNWAVFAGYIAEVINVKWDRYIQNKDWILPSSTLHINNWDTLYLKDNSEIIFSLDDNTKWHIIWPAIITISKTSDNHYEIILNEWKYFQITNQISKHIIDIITDEITINSERDKILDLQLTKTDKKMLIKNQWDNLNIKKNNANHDSTNTILTKETIEVLPNDINHIADSRTFELLLKNDNISETISINSTTSGNTNKDQHSDLDTQLAMLEFLQSFSWDSVNTGQNSGNIQDIIQKIDLSNQKKVPTQQQTALLQNVLNNFFLQNSFDRVELASNQWDTENLQREIQNLKDKLNSIQTSFSLWHLSELSEKYYISPSDLDTLNNLISFVSKY